MSSIQSAYINALLADAAYVSVSSDWTKAQLETRLNERMTPTQATFIANNFEVASSIDSSDAPLLGSGFDAIVWRGKAGGDYAGQVFVSMRGTELVPGADLLADGDLATSAGARFQIMDMVNWWLREATPAGQMASQIKWDAFRRTDPNPLSYALDPGFVADTPVFGTGGLVGVGSVQIDGHSLGGHLATAFARIFGANNGTVGSVNVQAVSTFNSAGFNGSSADTLFQNIQSLLGTGINGFSPIAAKQTNYFGQNGAEVTTNAWWFNQMGQRVGLYQEDDLGSTPIPGVSDPFSNHYMYKLTDFLALGAVLEKLDRTFTFDKLNELIKVGSNVMAGSYEGVLDALLRMLVAPNIDPTPIGDVGDSAASRVRYHEVIAALLKSKEAAFTSLEGKLIIKASSPTDLIAAARDNFGALVALQDLSPFVLSGINPAANDLLDFFLESARAGDYAAWKIDKSSDLPAATFTDQWITDRATMLGVLLERNKFDQTGALSPNPSAGLVAGHYLDVNSGVDITVGLDTPTTQQYLFGGDSADTLTGRDADDHLYGGGGADTLDGQGGGDYLEGNAGDDTLTGGQGNDVFVGGLGDERMRRRTRAATANRREAANDEATHAWRDAA